MKDEDVKKVKIILSQLQKKVKTGLILNEFGEQNQIKVMNKMS